MSEALAAAGIFLEGVRMANQRAKILSSSDASTSEEFGEGGGRDQFTSKVLSIHRADLHAVLLSACAGVEFRLGCTARVLADATDAGGRITVAIDPVSGSAPSVERDYDLVVGADGVHSSTRAWVIGEDAKSFRYAGYTCWRSVVSMPGSQLVEARTSFEFWGRGKRFGFIPLPGERLYFYSCINAREAAPEFEQLDLGSFVRLFEDLPDAVQRITRAVETAEDLHHDDLGDVSLPRWSRGGVLLIGDAAHATTPNMGQGAALAIEDASVLSAMLAEAHRSGTRLPGCLAPFETRRRSRVERLQKAARRIGAVAQWRWPPACWLRDHLASMVPNRIMERQLREIVDEAL